MSDNSNNLKTELLDLIKHHEESFKFIQDYAFDGIWFFDLENPGVHWISDKFWILLGYNPTNLEESLPSWESIIFEDDLKNASEAFYHLLNDHDFPFDVTVRFYTAQKNIKYIRCKGMIIFNNQSKPSRLLGVHQDVSQYKTIEKDLHYQISQLDSIIEGSEIGTWQWNVQTGETIFNQKWADIIGYTIEELGPTDINTWIKYSHPDDLKISSQKLDAHFKGLTKTYECECRMKHRNGKWIWILDRGKVITYSHDGKPEWMSGSHQDITNKKAVIEQYKIFIQDAPSAIAMFDKELKYIAASRKWLTDYEITVNEKQLIGQSHYEIFPEITEDWKQIHKACLNGNKKKSDGEPFIRKDGTIQWLKWDVSPWFDDDNKVGGLIMSSEDITQIKKLDELTNLMRITEDQNERLVNFSHIVSHNLRSHVANFEMILSLLEKQEEQIFTHPLIQLLSESSKKLDETIRHLNEVVQMNLNKDNQIVEMDLSFAVLSATRITSTLAKENNVEIINDVQNSVMIKAIPAYVDSIILNMLTNAIRYKSDKSPAFVKLSTIITSNYTQLLVEDNGLGIDLTKYGNKLFGLYKTFHEHKESRGVGLFISKNQALSMKGEIKVESQPGIGSKFIISFLNA